ncbi:hypothetical protein [Nocardioides zeae]
MSEIGAVRTTPARPAVGPVSAAPPTSPGSTTASKSAARASHAAPTPGRHMPRRTHTKAVSGSARRARRSPA